MRIAAKLRGGGPILQGGLETMACGRVTAPSDRHRQSMGRWFGFVAPPPLFFVYLISATSAYLALVEITKSLFYHFTAGR